MGQPEAARLRVGVVGASLTRGWAASAHLPALRALPGFEVTAVATTRQESADAVASAHGIAHAFADARELARHPDVDVVAVTVKVTAHDAVVRAALQAGKHVFCEWPLGTDLAQARQLADLADKAGVRHVVGLQGLWNPGARYVGELIGQGAVGTVRAVSAVAVGRQGGGKIPQASAYATAREAGASVLTITTGHLLATLGAAVGTPRELTGVVAALTGCATVAETGEVLPVTAPDQVVLAGQLEGGAALSVAVQGGAAPAAHFEVRVVGTDATLMVAPDASGASIHVADWQVTQLRPGQPPRPLPVPARFTGLPEGVPAGPPRGVALLYAELAAAIGEGRPARPSFADAVGWHGLLTAADRAAQTGTRQQLPPLELP